MKLATRKAGYLGGQVKQQRKDLQEGENNKNILFTL